MRLTTLPPSCAVVMKSGDLNFLEPSGPLQACNGTALPFITEVVSVYNAVRTEPLYNTDTFRLLRRLVLFTTPLQS